VRTPTVAAAVLSDPTLTSRQKRTLLDVYDAFRRENAVAEPTPIDKPARTSTSRTTTRATTTAAATSASAAPRTTRRRTGS